MNFDDSQWGDIVSNVNVYDLYEAVRASKFPMATDVQSVAGDVTERTEKLASSPIGEGHDNFLSGILVSFDLTFTNKAWVEFERYHFAQIVSSQSTMHRITRFDLNSAYCEYVSPQMIDIMQILVDNYNNDPTPGNYLRVLYSNPAGFKLTARIATNYRQLKTMYRQRKNHRLPEWRRFCAWMETLPHSEFITGI